MIDAENVNIALPLARMANLQPDTPAIIFPRDGRTITFRELDHESSLLATGFRKTGIHPGMRVALLVPPSPELFMVTFGLFKAGAVPVFIDPGIGAPQLKGCLNEAEPEAFIGIPKAHVARRLLGWGKKSIRISIVVNGGSLWGGIPLTTIRSSAVGTTAVMAVAGRHESAAILFTSGSTGSPKGAVYSHGTFAAQIETLRELYDIRPGEIDLPTFPLFALFAPALGMTALIPEMDFTRPGTVDPQQIFGPAAKYSATTMFGSPALLNRVSRYGVTNGEKFSTITRVISAGAPVPATVLQRFTTLLPPHAEIFTPYGATEALPVCSIGSREILGETAALTAEGHGVCVGSPVSTITLAIIHITDEPVPLWYDQLQLSPYEVGEIVVRGPQVSREYLNRPEATKLAKITDPTGEIWHRMGDLGYVDNQGRVWFCGRKSHRVEAAEETLFTIPVEGIFNGHPSVFRTALVGVGVKGSQHPVLCVELEADKVTASHNIVRNELIELASRYPHTKNIRTILFHPSFPVDIRHNAKIFREKLAIWAGEHLR